jgi:hypothetical protein
LEPKLLPHSAIRLNRDLYQPLVASRATDVGHSGVANPLEWKLDGYSGGIRNTPLHRPRTCSDRSTR